MIELIAGFILGCVLSVLFAVLDWHKEARLLAEADRCLDKSWTLLNAHEVTPSDALLAQAYIDRAKEFLDDIR